MSAAEFVNLTIEKGATYDPEFVLFEPNGTTKTDLTGHTARFVILDDAGTVVYESTKPCTATGQLVIDISDEETTTLPRGKFVHDLFLNEPSGKVRKLAYGNVSIKGHN